MTDYNAEGLAFAKAKNYADALTSFKAAISENAEVSLFHNNISNVYVALGDMNSALQHLHHALRLDPLVPEIYNNLGRLYYKQGLIETAIPLFEKALRMNSDYWEAHYNLAHSLASINRYYDAATHYRESLRLQPNHATTHFNLALTCIACEDYSEAYTHLNHTLALENQNLEALKQLGEIAVILGKKEEAIAAYEQYLAIEPNAEDIQHNLAVLRLRDEEREKALAGFKKALALNPKNMTAVHMTRALSGEQVSRIAPKEYIINLFNQYADYYNEQVKHKLKYQVPGLMRNAVGQFLGSNPKAGRVLDLGCGTGLCGVYFRDLAFELVGIDLSEKMIEKAKQLDTYDQLIVANIEDYLKKLVDNKPNEIHTTNNTANTNTDEESTPFYFNTILAGDVFVYIGDLSEIFKLSCILLDQQGFFIFTVEVDDAIDYTLQPTGRFAHSSAYIHSLSTVNNLKILLEEDITPREHEGKAIPGRLYIVTK